MKNGTVKLDDVVTLYDSLHKTPAEYTDEGYPMVRVTDIRRGFVNTTDTKRVDYDTYREFSKKHRPTVGDVLFTRVGSYGNSCFVNRDEEMCLGQNTVCISPDQERLEPYYLYCCLNSEVVSAQVEGFVGGASQPTISLRNIKELEIPFPDLPTQRRIAGILSAYDDLIENNLRRIRILEEMAQSLYREWFVHFRFPGHESVPLVDSPLGPIPDGWEVKKLKDACRLTMGQSPKSEFYNTDGEGTPFHQGVTDFGDHFPSDRLFCTVENRIAEDGDVLFSVRAPVGRINVADKRIVIGRGVSAIRAFDGHQDFLCFQLKHLFQEEDSMGNGAIFNAVTKSDMQGIDLLLPPIEWIDRFESTASPAFQSIKNLTGRNETLRQTRDLLLPKLLSPS